VEKFIAGVNDTGEQFIGGVVDTSEQFRILRLISAETIQQTY
jgi:hypothetical protein